MQFQDNGVPIEGCTSQSLTAGKVSSSATCSTNAGAAGKHQITVTYAGDADFSGSIAPTQEVNVQPEHKEEERKEKHEEHKEEQEPKQEVKGARSGSEPLVVGRTVGASVSSGTVTIPAPRAHRRSFPSRVETIRTEAKSKPPTVGSSSRLRPPPGRP